MQSSPLSTQNAVASLLAAALLLAAGPTRAEVAASLDAGLTQLATDIVTKSKERNRNKIAVLPFPNTDGTCSVLSNFLVDKLVHSLFQVPDSGQTIVERFQLETLLDELEMGEKGLLDASTTQKLGSLHGVQALVLGSITPSANQVDITARLVATDTGSVFAAAATTIPRTSDVSEWLSKPVTTGPTCGAKGKRPPAQRPPATSSGQGNAKNTTIDGSPQSFTSNGVRFEFKTFNISYPTTWSGTQADIVLNVLNTTDKEIQLVFMLPNPLLIDYNGNKAESNLLDARAITGAYACLESNPNSCYRNHPAAYVILRPDEPEVVALSLGTDKKLSGKELAFKARVQLIDAEGKPINIPISLAKLTVTDPNWEGTAAKR